ncbi:MAG: hypothetical protein HZB22_07505 [Deltaproteobacteria bacterium]|nr:hypothetical protein [Deltaproteobacteria bacterium]
MGLIRHLSPHIIILAAISAVILTAYFFVYEKPVRAIWLEAEYFLFDRPHWVVVEDVNFSYSKGIMTRSADSEAIAPFEVKRDGDYAIWIKYFGNYADTDVGYWKKVYTNQFGYIDYFGADRPATLKVKVDGMIEKTVEETGPHRYRWARLGPIRLGPGSHTMRFSLADGSPGGANLDSVLITDDLGYAPGAREALPRQVSEYIGPLLIIGFPLLVWAFSIKGFKGEYQAYLLYGTVISAVFSILWIDTDGGFWIWLTQNPDFNLVNIYSSGHGEALHHRYVYQPPVAAMLIGLRFVFSAFGAMDGITPLSLLLSKLIVIPFFIGTGVLLHRLEGEGAALLWALNSIVIFTVAADSMYFGLGFLLTLALYLIRNKRRCLGSLALGGALAYMPATILLIPPFLILIRGLGWRRIAYMLPLIVLPAFLLVLPYRILDPAGVSMRMTAAGISAWMPMHLGVRLGAIGVTTLLYGALLAFLWVRRPAFDYENLSAAFAAASLVYLNIGAPHFLEWTVAFQPFIIIWARRLKNEVFYGIYVTALMVWGSFYMNTGGAADRAGETGFFPYYIFYTWPFDIYRLVARFYPGIEYFSRADVEALSHSVSAGVSVIMALLIVSRFVVREDGGGAVRSAQGEDA